jgi:hypothetical protein
VAARAVISPEEGAEVQRLYAELPIASNRASNALRTNGRPLEGIALHRFLDEEAKVVAIVQPQPPLRRGLSYFTSSTISNGFLLSTLKSSVSPISAKNASR